MLLADFIHHPFADGGVGAGNAGLAVVKVALASDFCSFKRGVFPVNAIGQFRRPIDGGLVRQPGGCGGLGVEIAVQLLLARGKIPDRISQCVQQRNDFTDSGMPVHNVCRQKLNENPLARECVYGRKSAWICSRKITLAVQMEISPDSDKRPVNWDWVINVDDFRHRPAAHASKPKANDVPGGLSAGRIIAFPPRRSRLFHGVGPDNYCPTRGNFPRSEFDVLKLLKQIRKISREDLSNFRSYLPEVESSFRPWTFLAAGDFFDLMPRSDFQFVRKSAGCAISKTGQS